jgi:hypothetical protein
MVPSVNLPNGVIAAINAKLDVSHVVLPDTGPFPLTEIVVSAAKSFRGIDFIIREER